MMQKCFRSLENRDQSWLDFSTKEAKIIESKPLNINLIVKNVLNKSISKLTLREWGLIFIQIIELFYKIKIDYYQLIEATDAIFDLGKFKSIAEFKKLKLPIDNHNIIDSLTDSFITVSELTYYLEKPELKSIDFYPVIKGLKAKKYLKE
ncbi:hypothetical protein GYA49_01200 [Candidatus Beckwithbacteria bacterium]|nr:hypothetical protein [Candidatus Beckwithbacteria bacterium]